VTESKYVDQEIRPLVDRLLAGQRLRSRNVSIAGWLLVSLNLFTIGGAAESIVAGDMSIALVSGALAALVGFLTYRAATIGVSIGSDEVIVRNVWRSERAPVAAIAKVELGDSSGELILRDGTRYRVGALSGSLAPIARLERLRSKLADALRVALALRQAELETRDST
jgi:hypothetical protein